MRQVPEIISRIKDTNIPDDDIYDEIAAIDARDLDEEDRNSILETFRQEREDCYNQLYFEVAARYAKWGL